MQGQIVNGYQLKHLLGRGGMAEVWYAENEIGLVAAVKVLNADLSHNEQIVERFHNEALMMVKLNHPNIRRVYGYGYLGDRHCIIMEYLEGEDLEALIKSGRRFTEEELRRWWNQSVDALNYTHAMGIVHRDIKPSNFFLDKSGDIKLLDFGIAKDTGSVSMTRTGTRMGTLMYMSPEQVRNSKDIDYRTDIYSMALTFVQLLSGKHPFANNMGDEFDIQLSIVTKPVDLSVVPEEWQGFLSPYLAKEPSARPPLRPFEIVHEAPKAAHPVSGRETKIEAAPREEHITQPEKKTGLWISLGVGAAVLLLLLVLVLRPKSTSNSYESVAYRTGGKSVEQQSTLSNSPTPTTSSSTITTTKNNVPNGAIQGVFSVSSTKQVYFSKGNLQYQASTNTWRFANNPWDCAGDANSNISSSYNGWIDLFGWGTGGNPTMISTSKSSYGSFNDWGNNSISNGSNAGWRTLTREEWAYVFDRRSTPSGLQYVKASLNGVGGVVLLPDDWNASKYHFTNANSTSSDYTANSISVSDWNSIIQPNGAVFLPASGGRLERKVVDVGKGGGYWAASNEGDRACYLYVRSKDLNAQGVCGRMNGFSVRLVCPVKN